MHTKTATLEKTHSKSHKHTVQLYFKRAETGEPLPTTRMKTMTLVLFLLGGAGLLAEVGDLFPQIPNSITFPLIVTALCYAVWQVWSQAKKEREEYRKRLSEIEDAHRKEMKDHFDQIMRMVDVNTKAIQEIIKDK